MTTELPSALEKKETVEASGQSLADHIKQVLQNYYKDLEGHEPAHLYQLVLQEVERPLLESVMEYTRGNQSKASIVLGLNRGTLRKKLKQYDIK
ncbi:MAG: Fis family transcriptional regulator [Gammaproteobacteria bacterium SG8_15]|jgi:Fis family transcriptional regulator|nr:MAG: Fis family transcriptional regulator [Gammaproteobacteria bacterium SG8_15]MCI0506098.1 DNA-binding transcriptional regulator Fis [Gammaproteobacteria bacterium]